MEHRLSTNYCGPLNRENIPVFQHRKYATLDMLRTWGMEHNLTEAKTRRQSTAGRSTTYAAANSRRHQVQLQTDPGFLQQKMIFHRQNREDAASNDESTGTNAMRVWWS